MDDREREGSIARVRKIRVKKMRERQKKLGHMEQ